MNTQKKIPGQKLRKLMNEVYERDGGLCINCGRWIPEGTKAHHVIFRSHGGADSADNLVMLCNECHYAIHHGGGQLGQKARARCKEYINEIYGKNEE